MDKIPKADNTRNKCKNCNNHYRHKKYDTCVYCMFYKPSNKKGMVGEKEQEKIDETKCICCNCVMRNEYTRHSYKCTYIN